MIGVFIEMGAPAAVLQKKARLIVEISRCHAGDTNPDHRARMGANSFKIP